MTPLVPVPAAMTSDSDVDQGPTGLVEKVPPGELELSVTGSGARVVRASPVVVVNASAIGSERAPAAIVCGCVPNASSGCIQTLNDFHSSFRFAPSTSPLHQRFSPSVPHAALPGSIGS